MESKKIKFNDIYSNTLNNLKKVRLAPAGLAVVMLTTLGGCKPKEPVIDPIVIDPITDFIDYVEEPTNEVITVNGNKMTEIELKAKYGDLYRWVEPLTEREIEEQFQEIFNLHELVWSYLVSGEKFVDLLGNGYVTATEATKIPTDVSQIERSLYMELYNSEDSIFANFKKDLNADGIAMEKPVFNTFNKVTRLLKGEAKTFSTFEKEVYVRLMRTKRDLYNREYVKQGITYECAVCEVNTK